MARSLIALCCVRTAPLREQYEEWHSQSEESIARMFTSAGHTGPVPTASQLFRLAAEDLYRDAQWVASTAQVRVLVPDRDVDEFLLSDAPALTVGPHYDPELRGKLAVPIASAGNASAGSAPGTVVVQGEDSPDGPGRSRPAGTGSAPPSSGCAGTSSAWIP
ncbi:hypothetical protein [Kitasatospora griseola]|uniref:hypothetical protein n=1 Tax=Kitasatospora griseola TaxID=2064 RepID=UPI0037F2C245